MDNLNENQKSNLNRNNEQQGQQEQQNNKRKADSSSKIKEYIGITGFKTLDEISAASSAFENVGINSASNLTAMYGFLVLDHQLKDFSNKGSRRPSLDELPKLINSVAKGMMPTIHYCSKSRDLNLENLMPILYHVNTFSDCKFLQLNLDWPSPEKVQKIKELIPDMYIIMQLNPTLQSIKNSANQAIRNYDGIVDKLLIDPSLGAGIPYDAKTTAKIMMKIDADTSLFSYVVCGGLDHENVYARIHEMKNIVKEEYPFAKEIPFSVDAEGRLRSADNQNLDVYKMQNYIINASRAMK